jgi:hypothetical protein
MKIEYCGRQKHGVGQQIMRANPARVGPIED